MKKIIVVIATAILAVATLVSPAQAGKVANTVTVTNTSPIIGYPSYNTGEDSLVIAAFTTKARDPQVQMMCRSNWNITGGFGYWATYGVSYATPLPHGVWHGRVNGINLTNFPNGIDCKLSLYNGQGSSNALAETPLFKVYPPS